MVKNLLQAGGAYKSGAVHLRATVHDRSALEVKKMIVNGQDLVPPFASKGGKISKYIFNFVPSSNEQNKFPSTFSVHDTNWRTVPSS